MVEKAKAATPRAMSTVAPSTSSAFSPSSGSSTRPARATPRIEPSVLMLYTHPTERSPQPLPSRHLVISGSVMPAQNVDGSMTARHTA